jgi:hypothetical protein
MRSSCTASTELAISISLRAAASGRSRDAQSRISCRQLPMFAFGRLSGPHGRAAAIFASFGSVEPGRIRGRHISSSHSVSFPRSRRRRLVFLVGTTRHDLERIIGQRPL